MPDLASGTIWMKFHETLRVTPAMQAGLADRVFDMSAACTERSPSDTATVCDAVGTRAARHGACARARGSTESGSPGAAASTRPAALADNDTPVPTDRVGRLDHQSCVQVEPPAWA